jgi:hypothetical protein
VEVLLKKLLLSAIVAGSLALPFAGSAFADQGGVPNDNACQGQAASAAAQALTNGASDAKKAQAQEAKPDNGRSDDLQAFRETSCPADPSAN